MKESPYPAQASRKNGRYFLSAKHLIDAKHDEEIRNSIAKRNKKKIESFKHHAWGCGCCVLVSELHPEESFVDAAHLPLVEKIGKQNTWYERDGKRVKILNGRY